MNGNAEALAILDGAALPVQDKELLKQMFEQERRKLQEEMLERENSLMAKIKEQEEQLKRLNSGSSASDLQPSPRGAVPASRTIKKPPRPVNVVNKPPPQAQVVKKVPAPQKQQVEPPSPRRESVKQVPQQKKARKSEPEEPKPVQRGPPPPGMGQCSICGRNFNEDRLEKHQSICEKTAAKQRKKFDSAKFRTAELTEADSAPGGKSRSTNKGAPSKPSKSVGKNAPDRTRSDNQVDIQMNIFYQVVE